MRQLYILIFSIITLSNCTKKAKDLIECSSDTTTKHQKAVFLVMGQSNAANFGESILDANCNRLYNFNKGDLYQLKDPLKGANGTGGSVWSRLGLFLMQNQFAEEIIFAPVAEGGVPLSSFLPNTALNASMLETITSLNEENHTITHILWHQGESNNSAFANTGLNAFENAQLYETQFLQLVAQIRSQGVEAPIFVSTTTRCSFLNVDFELQQVQQNLKSDSLKIFNGPNTDILGLEYRYDGCHFNDKGLEKHAEAWLDILLNH